MSKMTTCGFRKSYALSLFLDEQQFIQPSSIFAASHLVTWQLRQDSIEVTFSDQKIHVSSQFKLNINNTYLKHTIALWKL